MEEEEAIGPGRTDQNSISHFLFRWERASNANADKDIPVL